MTENSTTTQTQELATDRQIKYLTDLFNGRDIDEAARTKGLLLIQTNSFTKKNASEAIGWLLKHPKKSVQTSPAPAEETPKVVDGEGFYQGANAAIYSFLFNPQANRKLWRRFVQLGSKWKYVKVNPVVAKMNVEQGGHKLTQEEAAAFGKTHGFCVCCGRLLTDPESVAAGIGPVCAKKTIWA